MMENTPNMRDGKPSHEDMANIFIQVIREAEDMGVSSNAILESLAAGINWHLGQNGMSMLIKALRDERRGGCARCALR